MRRIRAEPVCRNKKYDGTALFHHTAYAASYTARSAMLQATAASCTLAPYRQDRAWICWTEDSRGQSKEIQG